MRRLRGKISFKISFVVLGLLVPVSILDIWHGTHALRTAFYQQLDLQGRSLARSAAMFSSEALAGGDDSALEEYTRTIADGNRIAWVEIRQADGVTVAEFPSRGPPGGARPAGCREYSHSVAIDASPLELGRVSLGLSTAATEAAVHERRNAMVGVTCLLYALCAVLLIVLLQFLVARPLEHLDGAAKRLGDGDLLSPIAVEVGDEVGRLALTLDWMRDRLHATYAHLREKNRELERLSRVKDEFVANITHELRTPMNGVLGMAELLAMTELDTDQRECVDVITGSGRGLLDLIESVLDFSKIEAGMMGLESVPFDLSDLVAEVVGTVSGTARMKGIEVRSSYADAAPRRLVGDPTRLRQVLLNLVGNAVKFTEVGHAAVNVECRECRAEVAIMQIVIEDTGVGIPEDRRAAIFEPFTQSDGSMSRRYGGTGLGLAITRQIVDLMGGTVELESAPGRGSRFTVTIPLAVATEEWDGPGAPAAREAEPPLPRRGLTVLLAEDNAVNRTVIERMLAKLGCTVESAANGVEAVECARRSPPDVILMDWQMPEMDGLEATSQIRELERDAGRRTTIIALTANAIEGDRQRCVDAGMDDYLSKPVTLHKLGETLVRWAGA